MGFGVGCEVGFCFLLVSVRVCYAVWVGLVVFIGVCLMFGFAKVWLRVCVVRLCYFV